MEYNTKRPELIISEYGRNIQKMIDHAIQLESQEERTKAANAIINAMVVLNPQIREYNDYKIKLWDHLFIMSDYKLQCDSPFLQTAMRFAFSDAIAREKKTYS